MERKLGKMFKLFCSSEVIILGIIMIIINNKDEFGYLNKIQVFRLTRKLHFV